MKNLYLILDENDLDSQTVFALLKASAEVHGLEVHSIHANAYDFSDSLQMAKEDGLYKISTDRPSALVVGVLLHSQDRTFYSHYLSGIVKWDNGIECYLVHQ